MPYYITESNPECSGFAVMSEDGGYYGCHMDKQAAIDQAVAISLSTGEPFISNPNNSVAQSREILERAPAPAKDQITGSDTNKPGSAKGAGGDVALSEATQTGLRNKVADHNDKMKQAGKPDYTRTTFGQLAAVYRRGSGAYSTSHRPGITRAQWSMARVNAYLYLLRNGRPENAAYITDFDLLPTGHPKSTRSSDKVKTTRAIDQEPPAYMRAAARRGLAYYEEGLAGDGITAGTIRDARLMAAGQVSDAKWLKIAPWIARHITDLDSPNADPSSDNYPSPGVVAHLLWGSGPSKSAAIRTQDYAQSVIARIEADQESMRMKINRALPDELVIGDYVAWVIQTDQLEAYAGVVMDIMEGNAHISVWDDEDDIWFDTKLMALVPIADLKKIEPLPTEMTNATLGDVQSMIQDAMPQDRAKWLRAAYAIKARLEGTTEEARAIGGNEVRTNTIELRAEGDGMTFTGYAAVFNSDSQPLPFIERIAPGAFKRSLQSRNRMMLLWNHDTSNPLASTRNGSLQMTEDNVGLRVTATLPDTSLGRDIATLVRSGVIDSMSFGFTVKRDSWSPDGQQRTLEDVTLFEVSLVSAPAYEGTAGTVSVRSGDAISADALADALLKIESGEELEPAQGALIADVVERLTKTEEVQEVEGDILALKQKKLALLMMGI